MNFLHLQVRAAVIGNYKHDRLFGRGEEYGETVIASAIEEVEQQGKLSISRHESKSGVHVTFVHDQGSNVLREATDEI